MEMGREGHSGLYTMHFSNLFPPPLETPADGKERKDGEAAVASASPPCSVTQFTQWHVLIRMNVENDVCFVKGDAKIFSPTPSLGSPMARGIKPNGEPAAYATEPDGIPIVPIAQKDRRCHVLIEGTSRSAEEGKAGGGGGGVGADGRERDGATPFRLEVHFDRLEAELLGLREPPVLEDVTFACVGYKGCGWHIGQVAVSVAGEPLAMPRPLRFLLKSFFGPRCTACLDPVYAIGYTCDECEATQYCSRECLQTHTRKGHGLLCPLLKSKYKVRAGYVATEVSDDTGLVAWWRCLDGGEYSILVDANNALGYAIEYNICTLRSAKEEGLRYHLIFPTSAAATATTAGAATPSLAAAATAGTASTAASASPPLPTEEEVVDFTCVLLREVNRSAILEGCVPLSSACLNYLYYFSPSTEITIQSHTLFFNEFNCDDLEGPITTVEEYVAFARPLHCLATLQIEHALKSPISYEFWQRIKFAKDVAIALVDLNSTKPCASLAEMEGVVVGQQAESLRLLSKIFVIMATRAPQDQARRWLEQAERSLRQCDDGRDEPRALAINQYRLAALLLLYGDAAKDREAAELRAQGTEILRTLDEVEQHTRRPSAGGRDGDADPAQQQSGAEANEVRVVESK